MRQVSAFATAVALFVALLIPAHAAFAVYVPPGNSEADEYTETQPDGKGNKPPDFGRDPEYILSPSQIAALDQLGDVGRGAAETAAATAPSRSLAAGSGPGGSGTAGGPGAGGSPAGAGSGAENAAFVPERGGLGGMLWVIVVAAAIGGAAYAIRRRVEARDR
jgi:hypothetical protein